MIIDTYLDEFWKLSTKQVAENDKQQNVRSKQFQF